MMPLFGIGITILVLAGTAFTMFRVFGGLANATKERERLLRVGLPARARVLGVQMGGMTVTVGVNRQLQLVINAEVHVQGRPPYPTQLTTLLSELQIPQVQPGTWVAVRVDPANPQKLALEATGVGPPGTPGPGMGAPQGAGGQPGQQGFGGAPQGYGAAPGQPGGYASGQPGGYAMVGQPVAGFKMPMGAKIGLAVGGVSLLVALGVSFMVFGSGLGGGSDVCKRAAACCRKAAASNPASAANCNNLLKTPAVVAGQVCGEMLKSLEQHDKSCK